MALSYNFIEIFGAGKLALSERPKIKEIKKLIPAGCDRVVTILAERGEQAPKIGQAVESCSISWNWLKVAHAVDLTNDEKKLFKIAVNSIYNCIMATESVLVHCSAGRHRTGMFAYALLRKGCIQHEDALKIITEIRCETCLALEEKYIVTASQLY